MFKHAVIIPTCGLYEVIVESAPRFLNFCGKDTIIIFSVNPSNKEQAETAMGLVKFFAKNLDADGCTVDFVWSDGPIGFANAVNKGIEYLKKVYGLAKYITIANDDLQVTSNWLTKFSDAIECQFFSTPGLLATRPNDETSLVEKSILSSKMSIVGPVSNGVFNDQRSVNLDMLNSLGIDHYAQHVEEANPRGVAIPTSFLSGFCVCLTKECLEDLSSEDFSYGGLFDSRFEVGGYEDDDLSVRAVQKGYLPGIVLDTFVGHQVSRTLNTLFAEQAGGVANYINYALKWEHLTQKKQDVVAAYRVSIKCINDIAQLRSSLMKFATVGDGIALLLTNHPKEALSSYDAVLRGKLNQVDLEFFDACAELPDDISECQSELQKALLSWVGKTVLDYNEDLRLNCKVWTGEFNERDERNFTHDMCDELGAEWIFSIDADEVIEDRITREKLQRILQHPNPMRKTLDISFINHWETINLVRLDPPFNSMHGMRIWRNEKIKQRIYAGSPIGLHCGNSPEMGSYHVICPTLRMRHLSHVRGVDRFEKYKFYSTKDQEKNPILVGNGGSYQHIIKQESLPVSIYNPNNGIGFYMLAYEGESWINIARWFDQIYGSVDVSCMVWTGAWEESDQAWLEDPTLIESTSKEDWFKTGPCWELAHASRLFKFTWIYSKMNPEDGLAACRNAALDYFHNLNGDQKPYWVLSMDPDETTDFQSFQLQLRRCAELNDTMAFMFKFANPVGNGKAAGSETIRMFRLDQRIRYSGQVHETLEESLNAIKMTGYNPRIDYFPMNFVNQGLNKTPQMMADKLKKYRDLLVIQLEENPYNSGAWVSLGLQYMNDHDWDNAEECLRRACQCSGNAFLAFKEYSYHSLRKAKDLMRAAIKRTPKSHPWFETANAIYEALVAMQIDLPLVDTGGYNISEDTILPDFPVEESVDESNDNKGQNEEI